jgi:hypothetical protein
MLSIALPILIAPMLIELSSRKVDFAASSISSGEKGQVSYTPFFRADRYWENPSRSWKRKMQSCQVSSRLLMKRFIGRRS